MTSASSARRTLLPILAIVAGVACVQGACSLRSLDYLGNGHGQDGAMMDSAKEDVAAPGTPSPDTAITDVFGQETLAENGVGDGSVAGAVDGNDDVPVNGAGDADGDGEVGLGTGGNCITQIIASGYAAGTAPPCSACSDGNGNSLATKCADMLGCLAPPKTSVDYNTCLNAVAGSSRVGNCVNALTSAGCPEGY